MTHNEFAVEIAKRLDKAEVPFMLAGSHGSSIHGQPRATNDVDLVVDPNREQLEQFIHELDDDYYASLEAALGAHRTRGMFNVIHLPSGQKADLIVRKNRPFSIAEFQRRESISVYGYTMKVATPEDIVLAKLEWNKITPSARQREDAQNVLIARSDAIEMSYLQRWANELGVAEELASLLENIAKSGD